MIRGFLFFVSCATVFRVLSLFSFFSSFFVKMAVFFVFLRNINNSIEILKIKILEYSYPPSQYFFVPKAFIRFISCRRKVALCHLAEWHTGLIYLVLEVPITSFRENSGMSLAWNRGINLKHRQLGRERKLFGVIY